MEGDTNAEIAGKLGRVVTTVERKLLSIRELRAGPGPTPERGGGHRRGRPPHPLPGNSVHLLTS
jgi:hypothetical protein